MSGDVAQMGASEARAITDRIKTGVDVIWELITRAYTERAWDVLGYSSWDDYCTREFGAGRLRLPREERGEVVASLRESGLSLRAIASAMGTGTRQVQEAIREQVCSKTTVDRDGIESDLLAEELIAAEPVVIVGTNGKNYTPPAPRPAPKPVWSEEELALRKQLENGETVVASMKGGIHANLISWADSQGLYVRIDRNTPWGNPFVIGDDGDRDDVIAKYAQHYLPNKNRLQERLPELLGSALGCWCAPEPCHGDALKRAAES